MKTNRKIILILIILIVATTALFALFSASKSTHRYAVFAGYNGDGTLHPYVITYLKALNEVTDGVVYISRSRIPPKEEEKLKELTIHYENTRHDEYDFGSYKRGYNWLKENGYLKSAKELIFANDSTYAPMNSFESMFRKMSKKKDLDFWGDLPDTRYSIHLNPYFLVFRKRVIQSKEFEQFINSITAEPHISLYITKYEVNLTPYLESKGFKWESFMPYDKMENLQLSDKNAYPLTLMEKYNHQFLPRYVFSSDAEIKEDKGEVLKYIEKHYPQRHEEIMKEIFPHNKGKK